MFKMYTQSTLEYIATVWSLYLRNHEELLERIQRKAATIVIGLSGMSYGERRETLKKPTVEKKDKGRRDHNIQYTVGSWEAR